MGQVPIVDQLINLKKQDIVSFHVPGHKSGNIYSRFNYKNFKQVLVDIDTTEIPGTDNLHKSDGCIKEAQLRAAEVFSSEETFFLVNGSTSGIYSMIMAATKPGDKVIVGRNCHQSVINSIFLGDLQPIYIYPEVDKHQGIALGISPCSIERLIQDNPDVKAVLITYPTYQGIACSLKKISDIVHKYDKILLVDEAHGAHLGLSNRLPDTALKCGADAVVQSTHKSLPALTQSSMLHIQGNRIDRDKLRFMLRMHQSSSPSYILMASLDMATMIYKSKGKQLMEELLENIEYLKIKLQKVVGLDILGEEIVGRNYVEAVDPTRLWISMQQYNVSGHQLEQQLREKFHIQMELSNLYGTLAITTIGNQKRDFDRLYKGIYEIGKGLKVIKSEKTSYSSYSTPKVVYSPKEAFYSNKMTLPIDNSEGFISGEYIIPFPPGIPLVIPGEVISNEIIQNLKAMKEEGIEILGLKHNNCEYIDVIDNELVPATMR
ncbi:aminotransferase class I/II-fold pyridoxal phosphate-dependent enzyme [Alkaliphilus peptidifermentans]|uniref:Arginine decarboxylase n=1 Tax=Alkaliphilus peptidifermentans DSM 18978 TaxID=1120976 RepID=A0A1G5APV1_9FIRM|nr:aminotransferase class I/II-fold pyridoxal phosphate-dependent enzyme [Alkaliphilus peptidifermentans]SCX79895.1 arginine decarboxylase [Alkaliphilus peptidifermentans DSM 18978]